MNIQTIEAIVLADAIRKAQPTLVNVLSGEKEGLIYLHMAPASDIGCIKVDILNKSLALLAGLFARLGKSDVLSFRESDGHLHTARLNCRNVVVTVYPKRWIAQQLSAWDPYPAAQHRIGFADLAD